MRHGRWMLTDRARREHDLPPGQERVLAFAIDRVEAGRGFPTFREVADHIGGASTNGVMDHLNALARKGLVERVMAGARPTSRRRSAIATRPSMPSPQPQRDAASVLRVTPTMPCASLNGVSTTYVAGSERGDVKIGRSKKLRERIKTLQTAHPAAFGALLVFHGDHEKELHDHLRRHRVRGEWFSRLSLSGALEFAKSNGWTVLVGPSPP